MTASLIRLLGQRRFLPLFLTQFFGAFNDNAYKLATLTMMSYQLSSTQAQSEYYQAMAGGLYILPMFVFSAISGQCADKYDRDFLIRLIKVLEVLLMILGGIALYRGNIVLMMLTLIGIGMHSTFFGPIRLAILPDHLPKQDLLAATGLIEASTFLGILLGTILGTSFIGTVNSVPYVIIIMTLGAAFCGFLSSLFIPLARAVRPDLKVDFNFLRATVTLLKQARKEKGIIAPILTISWFWLACVIILTKLPDFTHYVLGGDTLIFALFLALFAIGKVSGSLLINWLLKGEVSLSIVPIAILGFAFFTFDLYWSSPTVVGLKSPLLTWFNFFTSFNHGRIAFDVFMLAFCAGLFVIPLYTYLQIVSSIENRARTIAANNICNALFMVSGVLLVMLLLQFNFSIPQVFFTLSLSNFLVALLFLVDLNKLKGHLKEAA